jgi:hypothetical protein
MKKLIILLILIATTATAATTIVTRTGKGSALTWGEVDSNFTNLKATADNAVDKPKFSGYSASRQVEIGLKAPLASPTFTGTVELPATTSIGNVSATELGYLDGVTSGVQAQLNTKLGKSGDQTITGWPGFEPTLTVSNISSNGTIVANNIDLNGASLQPQLDGKVANTPLYGEEIGIYGGNIEMYATAGSLGLHGLSATLEGSSLLDITSNTKITINNLGYASLILGSKAAPLSATATGITGEIRFDTNFIYRCVATNVWKRTALTTW